MTQSGWFPDPQGGPDDRYFDGSHWTEHTRPNSVISGWNSASSATSLPPQSQLSAPRSELGAPPAQPPRGNRTWRIVLVGGLAAALLGGIGVGVAINSSKRAPAPAPVTSSKPAPSASSAPPAMMCERPEFSVPTTSAEGRMSGSGLSVPRPPDSWSASHLVLSWIGDDVTVASPVYASTTARSTISLVTVSTNEGMTPQLTAQQVISCFASDLDGPEPPKVTSDTSATIDGKAAWRRAATIVVPAGVKGVTNWIVDVTVVDTGSQEGYSVLLEQLVADDQASVKDANTCRLGLKLQQ